MLSLNSDLDEDQSQQNRILSVFEAENEAANRGLIKKFSYTGSNTHMCTLMSVPGNELVN